MIKENIFNLYQNDIFVETGSYIGDGVQAAIDAGFNEIYSCELSPVHYEECKKRFDGDKRVNLELCKSDEFLTMLSKVVFPATIWLDAHYSGGNTALGKNISPLMEELDTIKKCYDGGRPMYDTILIDDMRCWNDKDRYGFVQWDVIQKLLEINPNFKFRFHDGMSGSGEVFKNDILVAIP